MPMICASERPRLQPTAAASSAPAIRTINIRLLIISPLSGPAAAVDALADQFEAAQVMRHVLAPQDLDEKRIEHFGPFRRDLGARLWPRLLAPIEAVTPRLAMRLHSA